MEKIKELNRFVESIGIDVSKLTLDVFLYNKKRHRQFSNNSQGFEAMQKWIKSEMGDLKDLVYCFEHTGWYCILLSHFLEAESMFYCCINPLEIKRSMGFKRGKTDKTDSYEIARFAWLRKDELEPSVSMPVKLIELQRLMSVREQLVKQCTALKNLEKGLLVTIEKVSSDAGLKIIKQSIKHLEQQISKLEKEMEGLIKTDEKMQNNYKLSKSVKGVGKILAVQMLLHTHNYTRFDEWRQFSAYCGLVPYPYQSGTSINGRRKIHAISDVKMKSLLSMSAISAIQHDSELRVYYQKRVDEGKPKMVALNIIRNKIVSRIFATIKRGTPYVELSKFAA
ncbi:MAG: IS110 family transposase [Bacteroidetes bacterium]|nr:IS110 family transposase [Bacteroidota bacterium]